MSNSTFGSQKFSGAGIKSNTQQIQVSFQLRYQKLLVQNELLQRYIEKLEERNVSTSGSLTP